MNFSLQKNPPLAAALVLTAAWAAFWLGAVQPADPVTPPRPLQPAVVRLPPGTGDPLRELLNPTLFAIPSSRGFSGTFPGRQVDVRLSLERPEDPTAFLRRDETIRPPEPAAAREAGHDD